MITRLLLTLAATAGILAAQLPVTPAQETADNLVLAARSEFLQRIALHKSMVDSLWNNPAAKPDKIIAAMGTGAGEFFDVYIENTRYLIRLGHLAGKNPTSKIPAQYLNAPRVKVNEDGTATMLPDPPKPAPVPVKAAPPSAVKAKSKSK